jgi:adenylosuccinate synthase
MSVTVVIGAQWGDEGKGKLAHLLSRDSDYVLRFQGGSNAGHTVKVHGKTYKLKLIPSGILHRYVECIMCDGVVIDPRQLAAEIKDLTECDSFRGTLSISRHAHLVLPYHRLQDIYFEEAKGSNAIGTTRSGIGPAYADKYFRVGLRAGDMLRPDFRDRVKEQAVRKNVLFAGYYDKPVLDPDEVWEQVQPSIEAVAPLVGDTISKVRRAIDEGAGMLCEGAQGTLLDIDYGTYPFVTSSHPISGSALCGTGINWQELDRVIGVTKAYSTRVGAGPFPTEDTGEVGDFMREAGAEYGTVTGRARRCGWLDLPLLVYATRLWGFTVLALTKTDILDSFDEIQVCVAYECVG